MDLPTRPGAAATAGPSFATSTSSHTRRASTPSQADATTPRHLYAAAHSVATSLGAPAGPAAYSRFDPSLNASNVGSTSPIRRLSELARASSASSQTAATGDASASSPPAAPMLLNRRTSDLGGAPAYMWSSSTSYGLSATPLGMGLGMSWRGPRRLPSSSPPAALQASLSTIAGSLSNASGELADDTVDECRFDPDSPYAVSPAVSGHHLSTRAHSPAQTPTPGKLFGSMDLIAGAETAHAGHRRSISEASHRLNLSGPVRAAAATPLSAAFRLPSPVELELVDLQGMFLRQQFRATQLERQLNECRAMIGTVVQYAEQRAQSASAAPSPATSPSKPVPAAVIADPADASTAGGNARRMTVEQQELALLRNIYQHLFAHVPHRDENVVLQDQVANLERQVEWLESALAQEQYLRVAAQMQNAEGAAWQIEGAAEQTPANPLVKLELEVDRLSRENRALVAAFQTQQQTASPNGGKQWELVPAGAEGVVGLGFVNGQESEKKRSEEELAMVLHEVEKALGIDGLLDCPAHHITDKLTAWKEAHDHALVDPLKALVPAASTDNDDPPMSPTAITAAAASRLKQLHQSSQTMTIDLARLREHLHRTRTSSRVEIESLQRTVSAHEEGLVSEDERRRVLTNQIDALTRTRDDLTQQLDRANEQVALQAMKLARLEATVAHTNDTVAQAQDALTLQTLAAANVQQELDRVVAMRADVEGRLQAQAAEWDAQRAVMVAAVKDAERKATEAARELEAAQAQLTQHAVDGSAHEELLSRIRDLEDQVREITAANMHFQTAADQRSRDLATAQAELQALRDQLTAAMKKADEQDARLVEAQVHGRTRAERIAVLENELQTAQACLMSARDEGAAECARLSAEFESMSRMHAAQADELRAKAEAIAVREHERAELLAQVATSTESVRRTETELVSARAAVARLESEQRAASDHIRDLESQLTAAVSERETVIRRAGERQMEFLHKLDAEVRQRSRAEAQVAELEQELGQAQAELRRLLAQSEMDANRESAQVATLSATIADLHAQCFSLHARIDELEHDRAELDTRRTDMEQRYQSEIEDLTAQLAAARQDRHRLETDLTAKKDELAESQQAARDAASRAGDFELVLDQANADLEAAQTARDEARAEVQRLSEQWAQACEREADDKSSSESAFQEAWSVAERATKLVRDREAQLKAMQTDLDHSLAVGAALREQTAALRVELDTKVEELVERDSRVRDLKEQLGAVQAKTKTAAIELAERDARVRYLEEQLGAMQAETKTAALELAQVRELLHAKSCEYQETVGELRLELEGSETKSYEAHAAIEELHQALDAARTQVAEMEAHVADLETQLINLDAQVALKSEIIATSGLEIQELRSRVATLEQQHVDTSQAHQAALFEMEQQHADAIQIHKAALAAERDAATKNLAEMRAELSRKTTQSAEATQSLAQLTAECEMAIQRHAEAQVQLEEHAKKITGLTNALDRMRGHAKRLSSDVESLEAGKQQITEDFNRQLETIEAEKQQIADDLSQQLKTLESVNKECREQRDALEAELTTLRIQLDEAGNDAARAQRTISELEVANKECREQRDALEAEVTTLRIQLDEARDGAVCTQRTTAELRHQVKELQTTKCTLANEVDAITSELECVSQARDEARRNVEQLQARLSETRRTIEAEYAQQLKQAHDELAAVIEARNQSWTDLNAARAELHRKDEAVNMLREQLEAVSAQTDTLAKQVEALTEEEHRCDSTMSQHATLAHELSEQLAEKNAQLAAAATIERDLREQLAVAKADAAQFVKKVASTQRQNQEAQSRLDTLEEQVERLEAKLGDSQLALQEAQYRATALESMLADKAGVADKATALEAELGVSQLALQEAQYRATAFESMLAEKTRAADMATARNDKLQAMIQTAAGMLGVPGTSDLVDVLAFLRDLLAAGNGSILSQAESIAGFLQFVRLNLEMPETASLHEIKTSLVTALECADKAHILDVVQRRLFATHFPVDQFTDWICCAVSDGVGLADELQKMEHRCRFAEKQLRATSSALEGERASLEEFKSQIAALSAVFGCDTVDGNPKSVSDALTKVRHQDLQHIEDLKRRVADLTTEVCARQAAAESNKRCASLLGLNDDVDGAVVCRELARFQEDYDAVVKEADDLAEDVKVWRDAWSTLVNGMAQIPGLSSPRDTDPGKVAVAVLDALRSRQDDRGSQDEELAVAGQVWHREMTRLAHLIDSTASSPLAVAQVVHDALASARHVQERIRACCQSTWVADAAQANTSVPDGDVQAHLTELEQFIRNAVKHRAAIRQLLADFPDLETDDLTTAVIQLAQRARHDLVAAIRDDESETDMFNRTLEARFDHLFESMSPVLSRSGRAKSPDAPIPCRDCQTSRMRLAQIENQVQRQAAELEKVVAFAHRLETRYVKASAEFDQAKVAVQDVYERLQHFSKAHQDAQRAHRQTLDEDLHKARAALDERLDRPERDSVSPSTQHPRCCVERDRLRRQLQEQATSFQEYRAKYQAADAAAWNTLAARICDLGATVTKATKLDQTALNTLLAEESRVRKDAEHLRDALAKTQRLLIQVETETKAATADLVADHQRQVERSDHAWEQRLAEMIRLKDQLIAEKNDQVRHLRKEALRAHDKLQRKVRECRCAAAAGPDAVSPSESVAAANGSHSLSSSTAPRSSHGLSLSRHHTAERDRAPTPERLTQATTGRRRTMVVPQSALSSTASLTSSISKTLETLERLG